MLKTKTHTLCFSVKGFFVLVFGTLLDSRVSSEVLYIFTFTFILHVNVLHLTISFKKFFKKEAFSCV